MPVLIRDNINLALFIGSLLLGAAGALLIAKTAYRIHLLDYPAKRSSHEVTTPKGGGVGILAAFLLASLTLKLPAVFVLSATLISVVSFYADSRRLGVKIRLIIHFLAAFLMIMAFLNIASFSQIFPPTFFLLLFCSLFVVATANFYNFMDGIDGMAGIAGLIGFGLIFFYYYQFLHTGPQPISPYVILAGCMAFSCSGFLSLNLPRAKVFMGDVGSILLGFVFAGLIMKLSENINDFVCMASFLFLFYADELTTLWVRVRNHEKLTQPHRRHLYQLLANELQVRHWKVAMLYGVSQLIVGFSVMAIRRQGLSLVLLFLSGCFLLFVLISFYIRHKIRPV